MRSVPMGEYFLSRRRVVTHFSEPPSSLGAQFGCKPPALFAPEQTLGTFHIPRLSSPGRWGEGCSEAQYSCRNHPNPRGGFEGPHTSVLEVTTLPRTTSSCTQQHPPYPWELPWHKCPPHHKRPTGPRENRTPPGRS